MVRLTARVSGVVQGVGFRCHVLDAGRRLRLAGWARNGADGSVEVVAEGEQEPLNRLVGELRRGPPGAQVDGLEVEFGPATGEYRGFEIRY